MGASPAGAGPVVGPDDWSSSPRFAAVAAELAPLAERFAAAGHRLYLVGGTVRDLLAGDVQADVDLDATTTARPAEIKRLLQGWADAIWTQGERFGTIGAAKRVNGPDGDVDRVFEITTHRAEAYRGDSRKPDVEFSDDVAADLSRRDFTVNAMAVEVTSSAPVLVDPFGGRADLAARVLRTPLTPAESFSDDPLRMLRAARFVTRYDLVPTPDLVEAVRTMGARLEIVSAERVRDELDKLLRSATPSAGLRFVLDTGLAVHVLPELTPDGVAVCAAVAPAPARRLARWAAVFEAAPDTVARARLRALRASTADVDGVGRLVAGRDRWFPRLADAAGAPEVPAAGWWSDGDVRRLAHAAGGDLEDLLALEQARCAAIAPAHRARLDTLRQRVATLASTEDLVDLRPELDGAEVMEALGVPAGRVVGEALAELLDLRLGSGPVGRAAAIEHLRQWWTHHSK